jgi:hypothetical protein
MQVPNTRIELSEGDTFSFAASTRTYELRCSAEATVSLSEEEMIRVGLNRQRRRDAPCSWILRVLFVRVLFICVRAAVIDGSCLYR